MDSNLSNIGLPGCKPMPVTARPPVIIIGMHRSGTTMVSRLLEAMGLFVGQRKEYNNEALFFLRLDEWIFLQSCASWENPLPIHYLLANKEIRAMAADYTARYLIESPRAISFLGWKKYARYRSLHNLSTPWGWKSPLSTFTLPLWLDIFPSAKVIHIYRHGVDVAYSLRERAIKDLRRTRAKELYYRLRFLHWLRPKVGGFIHGVRITSLEGGFSLWEEYVSEACRHVAALGARAMEVRYEDVLEDPLPPLRKMAEFCGLEVTNEALANVAREVKPERAYAYRHNPELSAYADRVAGRLAQAGGEEAVPSRRAVAAGK
jgi:hypothetical protein